MTGTTTNKVIIVGPSHAVRWEHAVKYGGMPEPFEFTSFVGGGGLPIWDKSTFEKVKILSKDGAKILLIVGDFRFGNAILGHPQLAEIDYPFADGFRNIDKNFIVADNDLALYQRSLCAIRIWQETFDDALTVINWTLLNRATEDISKGLHMSDGIYNHPTWGNKTIQSEDVDSGLDFSISIRQSLYIDSNLHPSTIGYFYLQNRMSNISPPDALRMAAERVSHLLMDFLNYDHPSFLVCGDSTWVESTCRMLVGDPLKKLEGKGVFIKNVSFAEALKLAKVLDVHRVLFIPNMIVESQGLDIAEAERIERKCGEIRGGQQFFCFPWDAIGRQTISKRHIDLSHLSVMTDAAFEDWVSQFRIFQDVEDYRESNQWFDLGAELMPTLAGLKQVLKFATS